MKIRPIRELLQDARLSLERFPLVMLCATVGALAMMWLTNCQRYHYPDQQKIIYLVMITALGITSFISLRVFSETHGWDSRRRDLWQAGIAAALVVYYFILPDKLKGLDINRYALVCLNLHLLVAIAPFVFKQNLTGAFWQYNKALFLRIVLAFIYSNTIYAGLAIALGVTDNLFDVIRFNERIYADLWFATVGIFNTWFFLSGIPKNIPDLESQTDYPKGLRIFTQFVLIPLVVLYIFILYMYMAKIIMIWSLPKGWLSSFILGVSVSGIMTLLLVHPLRDSEEFAWIRAYSRYFYLALFPLIVLMAIAVGRRIADYGITEQRYFILLFTVWLLIVALRFTVRPLSNIRFIPISLFILTACATWGPWSAMSVSKWSQTARLKTILKQEGLLVNGVITKKREGAKVEGKTAADISSIVGYLEENFSLRHLEKWASPVRSVSWAKLPASEFVTKELGLEYTGYYDRSFLGREGYSAANYFNLNAAAPRFTDVGGFDYLMHVNFYSLQNHPHPNVEKYETPHGVVELSYDPATGALKIKHDGRELKVADLTAAYLKDIRQRYNGKTYGLPENVLTFNVQDGEFRCRFIVTNINGVLNPDLQVQSLNGTLMVGWGEGLGTYQ